MDLASDHFASRENVHDRGGGAASNGDFLHEEAVAIIGVSALVLYFTMLGKLPPSVEGAT